MFLATFAWSGLGEVVLRTTVVYVFLLVALRLAGKRQLGQMTLFDLVVILTISNAVQNAMVGSNATVTGGCTAAATLLLLNYGVSWLRCRSTTVARWVGGMPTTIVEDGQFVIEALRRENLGVEEVLMAMREHGIDHIEQVQRAMLETDGSISVVPIEQANSRPRPRRHVRVLKKSS